MYRVFRTKQYKIKLEKIDYSNQKRVLNFEQSLKIEPYSGKPLGYNFFREKKFDDKRILFLIYPEYKCIFLITITNKKTQQKEIDLIKSNLDLYKNEIGNLIKKL